MAPPEQGCGCFACTSDMADWFPSAEFQAEYQALSLSAQEQDQERRLRAEQRERQLMIDDLVETRDDLARMKSSRSSEIQEPARRIDV